MKIKKNETSWFGLFAALSVSANSVHGKAFDLIRPFSNKLSLHDTSHGYLRRKATSVEKEPEDPYLWLEDMWGEQSLDWVSHRNKTTLAALQTDPAFNILYVNNLKIQNSDERIAYPHQILGSYLYNFWQDEKNERGRLRRTTLDSFRTSEPEWETVFDLDELATVEHEDWVFMGGSCLFPEYERCLLSLSHGGADPVEVREYDMVTRSFVEDGFFLPESSYGTAYWIDKNTLIVTTDFGEGTKTFTGMPRLAKLWKRGTPLENAELLFEGSFTDAAVLSAVKTTPERNYVFIVQAVLQNSSVALNFYALEDGEVVQLNLGAGPLDVSLDQYEMLKGQMLVTTNSDWISDDQVIPKGSLISIDYEDALVGKYTLRLVEQPDEKSSISWLATTKDSLLVGVLDNVVGTMHKYHFDDGQWQKERISAPANGTISIISTDENSDLYFFQYENFLTPSVLYIGNANEVEPVKSLPDRFEADDFEVNQFEAVSKDGTKIPYFIVHRSDMVLDGTNPTLQYGYGGFGIPELPRYDAMNGASWLANGGVYVLANIRGGGEFGPEWHQAAIKEKRQKSYNDFIAVAENLIEKNVTSPANLGIMGASNGGLLVGVAFTQRPDLFNAVVCLAPVLDMKRYKVLSTTVSTVGEYGDPDVPEEWEYIRKYSPYHNLSPSVTYPKVFFSTSTNDDRVHPAHARKMVAMMEGMGHDVYYFEPPDGGHMMAVTSKKRALLFSLIYTYLFQQLSSDTAVSPDTPRNSSVDSVDV